MHFEGVPGHEFVGVALDGPLAGRRVVGEINAGCGECPACRGGDPRHCPTRTVLGILGRPGAFAEELSLPTGNLLPVPEGISDELAVFTEPLAAALAVLEAVPLTPSTRVGVAGDGRLGILVAHALASAGKEVVVFGRHPERQALLPRGCELVPGVLEADSPPRRPEWEVLVEATGSAAVLARALELVRPRGTLVLKTTVEEASTLPLAPLVVNEIRLVGSRCGRFAPALELLASDPPPLEKMIDHRFPLEEAPGALEVAGRQGCLKVLIEVSG